MRNTFRMEDQNITMIRGDTLSFGVEIMDKDGGHFSQDLDTAFFTCKHNKLSERNIFQKSLENGISKADTGKYIVRVAPEDTKRIEAGKYFYDLQISVNEDIFTILHGILEIEQDVTY